MLGLNEGLKGFDVGFDVGFECGFDGVRCWV